MTAPQKELIVLTIETIKSLNMNDNNLNLELKSVRQLKVSREVTATHLPIGHSFIPYDILLVVANTHMSKKPLTIKSLFASLPYSDMGTRYHFNHLKNNGWIELVTDKNDSRNKLCKPSKKFHSKIRMIAKELEAIGQL